MAFEHLSPETPLSQTREEHLRDLADFMTVLNKAAVNPDNTLHGRAEIAALHGILTETSRLYAHPKLYPEYIADTEARHAQHLAAIANNASWQSIIDAGILDGNL